MPLRHIMEAQQERKRKEIEMKTYEIAIKETAENIAAGIMDEKEARGAFMAIAFIYGKKQREVAKDVRNAEVH